MEARRQRDPGADGGRVLGDQPLGQRDRLLGRFDRRGYVAALGLDSSQDLVRVEPLQLGPRVPLEIVDQRQRLADPRINQRLAIGPQLFRGQGVVFGAEKAIDRADGPIA